MEKVINTSNQRETKCCYLINLLQEINDDLLKGNFEGEIGLIIEIFWGRLDKDKKLCKNCDPSLNFIWEKKSVWKSI